MVIHFYKEVAATELTCWCHITFEFTNQLHTSGPAREFLLRGILLSPLLNPCGGVSYGNRNMAARVRNGKVCLICFHPIVVLCVRVKVLVEFLIGN